MCGFALFVADGYADVVIGFFKFEALTLCPIQKEAICIEMMNNEEIDWLNSYHAEVYRRLSPLLDEDHRKWLEQQCTPI